jgi:chitinase
LLKPHEERVYSDRRIRAGRRACFAVLFALQFAAWLLLIATLCSKPAFCAGESAPRPVVVGYVFPQNDLLQPGQIDARRLTRINYAFADLQQGLIVNGHASDDANLAALVALKRQNPSLTVLISVGGWFGSGGFSDLALSAASRAVFIRSADDYVERHQLDGLDLDWEYPGVPGAGNRFRPEDRQNYTLLLTGLRQSFDSLQKQLHRRLYLTIAAAASSEFIEHTEMDKVAKAVDTVNLMAYDYYEPPDDRLTGNHAPLFTDPADPKQVSADRSVRELEQAGVPAAKIVLGIPFYSRAWSKVPNIDNGLFQPGKSAPPEDAPVGDAVVALANQGFVRWWDSAAAAPSLYNSAAKVFVSYEDPQSIAEKCRYVLENKLAGVMFWNYEDDSSGTLLDAIDAGLGIGPGAQSGSTGPRPRGTEGPTAASPPSAPPSSALPPYATAPR